MKNSQTPVEFQKNCSFPRSVHTYPGDNWYTFINPGEILPNHCIFWEPQKFEVEKRKFSKTHLEVSICQSWSILSLANEYFLLPRSEKMFDLGRYCHYPSEYFSLPRSEKLVPRSNFWPVLHPGRHGFLQCLPRWRCKGSPGHWVRGFYHIILLLMNVIMTFSNLCY